MRVVADVPAAFREVVEQTGPSTVALSGGGTARRCYERLAASSDVDWPGVTVFFGDERWVPVDHEDSNEGMARRVLLDHVPVAAVQSVRSAGSTPEAAARSYDRLVGRVDRIDLVHLGLGEDGHTASLFPGSPALDVADRDVVAVAHHPVDRVTFTYPAIARAHLVVVTVAGESKRAAFQRVRDGDPSAPATRVDAEAVLWLVDPAAAGASA